ncbi:MAG: hypothetical protein C4521_02145 [Actinobacteria bacterium]|nr:MAG: hypothetical protein C4521_02145 [Actinomycetota bacterium]
MKKALFVLAIVAVALIGLTVTAYAATSDPVTVTGRLNPKIVVSVDNTTVAFGTFDPDVAQEDLAAFTATVKSNKSYDYSVDAPAAFTGGSTPAINHLEWDRGSGYAAFAAGANDFLNSEPKTDGAAYTYDLRLTFGYDEDPDVDYTADLVPTAVQE